MPNEAELPLSGLLVLDMSQFLSGPYSSLRLFDFGARVIKIERPDGGDLSRRLYLSDTEIGGDSTIFHAINRGKESLALDLKNEVDRAFLRRLIATADVLIQNFRPGVIDRLGLGYDAVKQLNPKLVYASISGYGENGEWATRPGQDLLAQARSGLMWLNGHDDQGPVPFGLAVADIMAGANLCQGILAALVRRGVTAQGAHVQTSLLESLVDLQFEVLTTHLNDGRRPPKRGEFRNAHAYLAAPYGVYPARDGFLAVAMTPLDRLQDLLDVEGLAPFRNDPKAGFDRRDEIKQIIAERIATETVDHWLSILEPAGVWCSGVLTWEELLSADSFQKLDMIQTLTLGSGRGLATTSCPIRMDGVRRKGSSAAPLLGEHSAQLRAEFS